MFRNQNEEVKEEKVESTLTNRSHWEASFQHAVALSDGIHLVAISRTFSVLDTPILMTWNIKNKQKIGSIPLYDGTSAIASLKNNEFVIADLVGTIYRCKIDTQGVPTFIDDFSTGLNEIYAMVELEDGSLAIAHGDHHVSIWNLTEKKEIKTLSIGQAKINTLDAQCNNFLFLGTESGIVIYNHKDKDNSCITHNVVTSGIKSLILLPDNTFVFLDSDANLWHYDPTNKKILGSQQIENEPSQLTAMPNGWIGCINSQSFLLFEPSWTRDYVHANSAEAKDAVRTYLLQPLTDIVLAYAGNVTLFNSPKMPHKKECVIATDFSTAPKGP